MACTYSVQIKSNSEPKQQQQQQQPKKNGSE